MRMIVSALILFFGLQAHASTVTVTGKVELHFDAVKKAHRCVENGSGGGEPNPGPGNCGAYQDLNFDQIYPSFAVFEGDFSTSDGVVFELVSGSFRCRFGTSGCLYDPTVFPQRNSFSAKEIFFYGGGGFFVAEYSWDLHAGTGGHGYVGDSEPYYPIVGFEFSNVVAKVSIPPVPLPASATLMLGAIAAFGAGRALKRRNKVGKA